MKKIIFSKWFLIYAILAAVYVCATYSIENCAQYAGDPNGMGMCGLIFSWLNPPVVIAMPIMLVLRLLIIVPLALEDAPIFYYFVPITTFIGWLVVYVVVALIRKASKKTQ